MLSSESINKFFNSLAKFVGRITGREVQFQQVGFGQPIDVACEKMNKLLEDAAEAINNPATEMLGILEPGKTYCLQLDTSSADLEWVTNVLEAFEAKNISVALINQDMNFVSIPDGYDVVRKEDKS